MAGGLGAIAGGGVSAYGQMYQAQATANADNFNAMVATENAAIATQKGKWAGEEGDQNASASEMKTAAKVGSTQANQGASGVTVGSGSSADVISSEKELGMLDALTIRSNAARSAYGYATEAYSDKAQSALDTYSAKNAITAGQIGAVSTLLGSAAQGSQYGIYQNNNSIGL